MLSSKALDKTILSFTVRRIEEWLEIIIDHNEPKFCENMNDMPVARATLQTFHIEGRLLLGMNRRGGLYDVPIPDREFRAHFGASPNVCFNIWQQCENSFLHLKVRPKHLLWGFLFLNTYATEGILARTCGVTRKTFRFWSWLVVDTIRKRKPDVIRLENRFRNDRGKTCKMTVDGVDFPIEEPVPFDRQWWSHKFKAAGLRYEMAVCIQTGDIVWVNGPFKCGKWPDQKIFKTFLMQRLADDEMVEADRGYRGNDIKARTPDDCVSQVDRVAKRRAMARHETVNRRLKQWGCMQQRWRHAREKHKIAFCAVVVCTQTAFDIGERPFQCRY